MLARRRVGDGHAQALRTRVLLRGLGRKGFGLRGFGWRGFGLRVSGRCLDGKRSEVDTALVGELRESLPETTARRQPLLRSRVHTATGGGDLRGCGGDLCVDMARPLGPVVDSRVPTSS